MRKHQSEPVVYENVEIIDAGSEGKAVARVGELVVFVPFVVPGDVADIKIVRKKKSFREGVAIKIHTYSDKRVEAFCEHFGVCGGCRWQNMNYQTQLFYKQKQVEDNFQRIGKFEMPDVLPIIASAKTQYYRNKLEYTFSNKRWLMDGDMEADPASRNMNALGFHIPQMFDRVLDINKCFLQSEPSNAIRLSIKAFAETNHYEFYDVRRWTGFLRNIVIRSSNTGDIMLILVVNADEPDKIKAVLGHVSDHFPQITSLMYVVNSKHNDVISDLPVQLYKGEPFIMETMENLKFKIGPVSFFQTNSDQAYRLYSCAREFAGLTGNEVVYDLYTGTGTIANFIASNAKKVVGIEYVESAIDDARENSSINGITNTVFYAGDMVKVLTDDFVKANGQPDVVITDPPRAGMHPKVVEQLMTIAPEKIVYVSCNPATQARDIALMDEKYSVEKIQPVDMFPHTQHVENVCLLRRR